VGGLTLYPTHYRSALASSLIPSPLPHQLPLQVAFPRGEATGLLRSSPRSLRGEVVPFGRWCAIRARRLRCPYESLGPSMGLSEPGAVISASRRPDPSGSRLRAAFTAARRAPRSSAGPRGSSPHPSDSDGLRLGLRAQRRGDRAQPDLAQRPF